MTLTKCWTCGNSYDGWECPLCSAKHRAEDAARQSARQHKEALEAAERASAQQAESAERLREEIANETEAIQEAAIEAEIRAQEAAEEHRWTTANAWRLQSEEKSKRARALYESGMYQEALQLAVQAIEQDPGNFEGFWIAAASSMAIGQKAAAMSYGGKLIQLLDLPENRSLPNRFVWVITLVSGQKDFSSLQNAFSLALKRNIEFWKGSESAFSDAGALAQLLVKTNRTAEACAVFGWLALAAPSSQITLSAALHLVKRLLQDGEGDKARWISDRLPAVCDSLLNQSYMFEIYSLVGNDAKKQFKAFLEKLDFHSRDSLDRDIPRVKGLVGKEITLEKVTEIIRMVAGKYVTWKPRLEHQAFEQAVRSAKSEGYNTHGGTVGVISFFALMFTSLFFLFSRGIRPDSNSVTPYWVFGTLAGAILVGSLVGSFEKRTRISRNTTARMASNYASLNANLESVGLSEAKPRHTLPIIAILLPIYVAVIIFYIVEWFAIMSGQQVKPLARVSPSSFGSRSAEASLFPIPHARVNRVRFFGSGYDAAPIGHRFYAASFPRQTSKYINWELDLTFPRVNRNYKFPIQTEWIGPRGNVFWRQTAWASVSAGWASMWESSGWGCRNPPCAFERGRYHVNLYVRGAKVASGTFEMY